MTNEQTRSFCKARCICVGQETGCPACRAARLIAEVEDLDVNDALCDAVEDALSEAEIKIDESLGPLLVDLFS